MSRLFAVALTEGSSRANHTGAWRTMRPEYVDRLPPCNDACPAGENVQSWLSHAEEGDYRAAWDALTRDNPLPAVTGRACYHPCESSCNRAKLDQAVSIHAVERFLGDYAIQKGWAFAPPAAPTGKRVLVIGAGPSGLSAAYHLAHAGHSVTVRESEPAAGGMLRYGIPRYRLPREVVDAEVARIAALGVAFEYGVRVVDIPDAMRTGGFRACFAAVGAHLARRVEVPGPDAVRVLDALSLLEGVENASADPQREAPQLGRAVAVYGGGNTAMDAARTARRLGAQDVFVIYRRRREDMPAQDFELREALEEGIKVRWLSTVARREDHALVLEKMRISAGGKPEPTGEFETVGADTLVLAIGQDVDLTAFEKLPRVRVHDGVVAVDERMMTGEPGLFAGGDMVPAQRSIAVAVGHGKKAARHVDAYLTGKTYAPGPRHEIARFEQLNTWYYSDADASVAPALDAARRTADFAEVHAGLDERTALYEARRCLSCGNCFECDNCYGVCPDNAVIKLGPGNRFRIDLDYCKGCGLCAAECPCGAIRMVPEEP